MPERTDDIRGSQRSETRRGQGYDSRRDRDYGYYSDPRRDQTYEVEPRRGYNPETKSYDYERDSRRSQTRNEYGHHVQDSRGYESRHYDPHHSVTRTDYYDSRSGGTESGYWPKNPYRSTSTTPLDSDEHSGYNNRPSHTVNYPSQTQLPHQGSAFQPPKVSAHYDPRSHRPRLLGNSSMSDRQDWQRNGVLKSHY